jgi:hypothetical protein
VFRNIKISTKNGESNLYIIEETTSLEDTEELFTDTFEAFIYTTETEIKETTDEVYVDTLEIKTETISETYSFFESSDETDIFTEEVEVKEENFAETAEIKLLSEEVILNRVIDGDLFFTEEVDYYEKKQPTIEVIFTLNDTEEISFEYEVETHEIEIIHYFAEDTHELNTRMKLEERDILYREQIIYIKQGETFREIILDTPEFYYIRKEESEFILYLESIRNNKWKLREAIRSN